LQGQVEAHFGRHPDAEIYLSQPGLGAITSARVLGELGDDLHRYASAKARRNYAGTSPITRAPGKRKIVAARFVRNDRLTGALMIQAFAALRASPGARAFYDAQRGKGLEHNDALRRLASRLAGILHGCLKTRTCYDEATARSHRETCLDLTPPLDIQTPGMSWATFQAWRPARGADLGVSSSRWLNLRTHISRLVQSLVCLSAPWSCDLLGLSPRACPRS